MFILNYVINNNNNNYIIQKDNGNNILKNEDIKREIVLAFYEISHDESPSVRRASADNIKNFCQVKEERIIEYKKIKNF